MHTLSEIILGCVAVTVILLSYLLGRFGFSYHLLTVCLAVIIIAVNRRMRLVQKEMKNKFRTLYCKTPLDRDNEMCDWLNKILERFWYTMHDFICKNIKMGAGMYYFIFIIIVLI